MWCTDISHDRLPLLVPNFTILVKLKMVAGVIWDFVFGHDQVANKRNYIIFGLHTVIVTRASLGPQNYTFDKIPYGGGMRLGFIIDPR